jgi:prepilin-type N-terminal cleavage/methylation domain-containing protein/prepilin-type processing-associated H-X9-DG protein
MREHFMAKRRSGFTLVELLVVIGIIAVLVSMLLPVLGKARQAAQTAQCLSNLKQFATADAIYVNEWKGWHVPGMQDKAGPRADGTVVDSVPGNSNARSWAGNRVFRKYLNLPIIETDTPGGGSASVTTAGIHGMPINLLCPTALRLQVSWAPASGGPALFNVTNSYGMNVTGVDYPPAPSVSGGGARDGVPDPTITTYVYPLGTTPPGPTTDGTAGYGFHGYKAAQVRNSSNKIMFADAQGSLLISKNGAIASDAPDRSGYQNQPHPALGATTVTDDKPRITDNLVIGEGGSGTSNINGVTFWEADRNIAYRHNKCANIVFFDGHGETVRYDKVRRIVNEPTFTVNNTSPQDIYWMVLK